MILCYRLQVIGYRFPVTGQGTAQSSTTGNL